jgi:hypothetical protein
MPINEAKWPASVKVVKEIGVMDGGTLAAQLGLMYAAFGIISM